MSELKRILLAEDDPRDVELILAALAEHNLANGVQVVEDGVQALDYLHRRGAFASRPEGDPVAVLLDLKMPRVDGLQVLTEMKADPRLRTVPIVMLTSSRESIDLEQCYWQGANAYVVKPVQFDEFMTAVKELGLFWAVVNEPPPGSVRNSGR
jgi:CheY-like chemotaxis protein